MTLATYPDGKPIRGFVLPKRAKLIDWSTHRHSAHVQTVAGDGSGTLLMFITENAIESRAVGPGLLSGLVAGDAALATLDEAGTITAVVGAPIGYREVRDDKQADYGCIRE